MGAVAVPSAQAVPAGSANGHALGGFTSQGLPIVIEVSGNGDRIDLVGAVLMMRCTSGVQVPFPDAWSHLRVPRDGVVHAALKIPPLRRLSVTGGTDSFWGKLNRARATFTGAWRVRLAFTTPDGQSDQCDSGVVSLAVRL
jgi:hypothetical protein